METLIPQIIHLLEATFSPDNNVVTSATQSLDQLSLLPDFAFALLSIATGGQDQGQRIAAATYLKNFIRRRTDDSSPSNYSKEFRNRLVQALLQAESTVLKVLIEAFQIIIAKEFVKENSWPELVPELRLVIQNSDLVCEGSSSQWSTINALTVLQAIIRPFQYFLNPNLAKETVPPQLELIAKEILVPLLIVFHRLVEKVMPITRRADTDVEKIILVVCKCIYFSVRSHMPSAIVHTLPSICGDLCGILDSLMLNGATTEDGYLLRLKAGKRSLLIFCSLVTRHWKCSDRLMPNITTCASKIVKQSINISVLDFPSERIVSLAFDVIARVVETGPGWRLVSPHFSSLIDSAIFPALVMNQKDVSEWEEDTDEYIRKNLPSDLEEISGWREDLFTVRKSAINLLGVIAMSKGPPMPTSKQSVKRKKSDKSKSKDQRCFIGEMIVLPFLSKFPIPFSSGGTSDQTMMANDYFGVLMAYGGLQDLLKEQNPVNTATLLQNRVLPMYSLSPCMPYLVATANWVLGELASCLSEEMSADVYSSLLKALVMPDVRDITCYPVRASAAGAIAGLLENDYLPPEWLPILEVVVNRMSDEDDSESSSLLQLLATVVEAGNGNVAVHIPYIVSALVGTISKRIPPIPEPWPQVVERGFSALAAMSQTWENSVPEETEHNEPSEASVSGRVSISRQFSVLLQHAWLMPTQATGGDITSMIPPPSCIDDASTLLCFIIRSVTGSSCVSAMKISELLTIWADLITDWHAWEELEDLSIFECVHEVINLHQKYDFKNFFVRRLPSPPSPPVPQRSIIEGIGAFVNEAISQYPSATWRACSCVHLLLNTPNFSFETESLKLSFGAVFSQAAFSRFIEIQSKPSALWKPLLLAISSCYLCCPDTVESILKMEEDEGFTTWATSLAYISTSSFEPGLSNESEIKLIVMTLVKVVERLLESTLRNGLLRDCFASLMEAVIRLKEVQEEEDDGTEENDEDEETDDDEDSEDDDREETEEEFLERYAKAAVSLEEGLDVEEGDADQDQELELGSLGEVDLQRAVFLLIERYNQVLIKEQILPPQLITGFVNTFPEYGLYFQNC